MKDAKIVAFIKQAFRGSKREFAQVDYWHKLSESERAWLEKFNAEYVCGKIKKGDPKALHVSVHLRRSCYGRNNSANRDVFQRFKRVNERD